jgi:hypothetical protein
MPFLGQGKQALKNRLDTGLQQGIWVTRAKKKRPDWIGAQFYASINVS